MNTIGNSDRPIIGCGGDEFEIQPYIEALSEFIKECETPMTVAVQGDWGCGKTSMMNMVRDHLKSNEKESEIVDVWFNTWQFSQFNMNDTLTITFLQHLLNELTKNLAHNVELKDKVVPKLKSIFKTLAVNASGFAFGEHAANVIEKIGDEITGEEELDNAAKIIELKSALHEIISKVKKRVVVYIDDLDRLQPACAVELLEILKLFVDCENCVFVMAIDTSVVFQGIREKYGSDMSDAKAQSFFDKMIQLPFKMPVAYYKLDSMIERLLTFLQNDSLSENSTERKKFISLLKATTGGNPRSLKRLVNSIMLLDKVAIKKGLYNENSSDKSIKIQILVSLSCLQHRFNKIYDFIVNNNTVQKINLLCNTFSIPDKNNDEHCSLMIKELNRYGMSKLDENDMDDSETLYELTAFFISKLKIYYDMRKKNNINSNDILHEIAGIISLNNIFNIITDSKAPASSASSIAFEEEPVKTEEDEIDKLAERVIQLINEKTTESKKEAHRLMQNAGYYYSIYSNSEEKNEPLAYTKLKEKLSEYFTIQEKNRNGSYTTEIEFNGTEFIVLNATASDCSTQIQIGFTEYGISPKPALSQYVQDFVNEITEHKKELDNHFGEIGSSKSFISSISPHINEDGKIISYYAPLLQRVAFTVFSEHVIDKIIEFAINVRNNPNCMIEKK